MGYPVSLQSVSVLTERDQFTVFSSTEFQKGDISLSLKETESDLSVSVVSSATPLREVILHWAYSFPKNTRFLGGAWERGYGDYQWRAADPERVMPWYFLADTGETIQCFGVKTQPRALCWWSVDADGFSLHLDLRCGGQGVVLGGRTLPAATVKFQTYTASAFTAMGNFMRELCDSPLLPPRPVYGSNNWYYAYGKSSHEDIIADAEYLQSLTKNLINRPYMVIDDGWQIGHSENYNGGPWRKGNEKFPDMPGLAAEMKKRDCGPGIWVRLLMNDDPSLPAEWRLQRDHRYLDPTVPGVLDYISEDIRTLIGWGYELIKHDFTTYDIFGRWGFQMGSEVTDSGWHFADESITSAEAIIKLYETILQAAWGKALILGCNTMGHLGAGLMHLNRTGDDTSGVDWERTRKMGVNTLAFTSLQHNAFYAIDADCVGVTGKIPWSLNRRWLRLLAKSGTPLFTSIKPGILTLEQEEEVRVAYALASGSSSLAVPLDWQSTLLPTHWKTSGEMETISWEDDE